MTDDAHDPRQLGTMLGENTILLGTATAAWQVEGSTTADGRGRSIWDDFADSPGAIKDGATGDPASNSYRRWTDDLDLLAGLGVDAYRLSVSWPRVQPSGVGEPLAAGLDHYERFVDGLVERGIRPLVTLYHWDLPSALQAEGGWLSRDTALRFADYAGHVAARMGDRVHVWTTLNEPWVFTTLGYALGSHAPGQALGDAAFPAVHHAHLAHGLGAQAVRGAVPGAQVSITLNLHPAVPDDPASAEDVDAARRMDSHQNRTWCEPVLLGRYPEDLADTWGPDALSVVREGDMATIAQPIDVLGVNYYFPQRVRADASSAWMGLTLADTSWPESVERTSFGWPVVPSAFTGLLRLLHTRYGDALPPIWITENGRASDDQVVDGRVDDSARVRYLDGHLHALVDAVEAGVDVRGYCAWTLLDNIEWTEGFTQRFGLVHVDTATGRRTPKDSFAWYRDVIAAAHAVRATPTAP